MNASDHVVLNDLGDVIAAVPVGDCRLEFRHQRHTGDLWCVSSGPLGSIALPVLDARGLAQGSRRDAMDRRHGERSRPRYAKWQQVPINDDLLIAFRARGSDVEFAYLFGDGSPFGGGGGWLPTARRATLLEHAQRWLSGRRGHRVPVFWHADAGRR